MCYLLNRCKQIAPALLYSQAIPFGPPHDLISRICMCYNMRLYVLRPEIVWVTVYNYLKISLQQYELQPAIVRITVYNYMNYSL